MFTGIVKGLATIVSIEDRDKFRVLAIEAGTLVPHPTLGASVSVSGVCLTITKIDSSILSFEVMQETLDKTTLAGLQVGEQVNIETPLRLGDELGGHIVQGHVDGTSQILEKVQDGPNTRMRFEVPADLAQYVVDKGSVGVDGISLTICLPATPAHLSATFFDVWLLPLTLERTTLGQKQPGDKVNLEIDYLVKAFFKRS
jgi:riboflavin synthase